MAIHGDDAQYRSDVQPPPIDLSKPLASESKPDVPKAKGWRRRDLKNHSLDQDLYDRLRAAQKRAYPNRSTWEFAEWLLMTSLAEFESAEQRKAMSERMVLTPAEVAGNRLVVE